MVFFHKCNKCDGLTTNKIQCSDCYRMDQELEIDNPNLEQLYVEFDDWKRKDLKEEEYDFLDGFIF